MTRTGTRPHQDGSSVTSSPLFAKLESGTSGFLPTVFDFQVGYDIGDNARGFSIFQFRWEDNDGTFSARTGFGLSGSDLHTRIDFLGNPDDIDDPTKTRVFRIKADAKVILEELDKNTVIATLVCRNDHTYEVTVAPNV